MAIRKIQFILHFSQWSFSCLAWEPQYQYKDLIFHTLWSTPPGFLYIFTVIRNFLSVRPVDLQRWQLEVMFYFRCCIMGLGVGLLVRDISLAMAVVMGSWITQNSLDPTVLTSNIYWLDEVFLGLSVLV